MTPVPLIPTIPYNYPDENQVNTIRGLNSDESDHQATESAQKIDNLVAQLNNNGTKVDRKGDEIYVQVSDSATDEIWEYLAALNVFIPVTHLSLSQTTNFNDLLKFVQQNKHISFLDFGMMTDLDDHKLNQLSENLTNLDTLIINNTAISSIPSKISSQLKVINCNYCRSLTSLVANNANIVNCKGCTSLTLLEANNAKKVYCKGCTSLTSLVANNASKVYCQGCTSLTSLEANHAIKVDCYNCTSLTLLEANNVSQVSCYGCTSLTSLIASNAKEVYCAYCRLLTSLVANNAKEVDCGQCKSLTSLVANNARIVQCENCTSLTSLEAKNANIVYCSGCTSLESLITPSLISLSHDLHIDSLNKLVIPSKLMEELNALPPNLMQIRELIRKGRAENNASLFEKALLKMYKENSHCQFEQWISECEFKKQLLKGASKAELTEPLKAKLSDPNRAEAVVGELADFARWADDAQMPELSLFFKEVKEEIRRVIEILHTQSTYQSLLIEQYQKSLESQRKRLVAGQSVLNLGQVLHNPKLPTRLSKVYENIYQKYDKKEFEKSLNKHLSILYPNEKDAKKQKIVKFFKRITESKNYQIDKAHIDKIIAAIIQSVCSASIEKNESYLKALFKTFIEGTDKCVNRATDALYKSEALYLCETFKTDKEMLYAISVANWKSAFLEQFVLANTMSSIFGPDTGSAFDMEVVLMNYKFYNELLGLNKGVLDINYLEALGRELKKQNKSEDVTANPEKLFAELFSSLTVDNFIDTFFRSPTFISLYSNDVSMMFTPEDIYNEAVSCLVHWRNAWDENTGVSIPKKLTTILERYSTMSGYTELKDNFDSSIEELKTLFNTPDELFNQADTAINNIIQKTSIALSQQHNKLRKESRAKIEADLLEIGYLVKPTLEEGKLTLDYPAPSNLEIDPEKVIEATLSINFE